MPMSIEGRPDEERSIAGACWAA